MSNKWQYTILFAVIAFLAALLFLRQGPENRFKPPPLPHPDHNTITRVRLAGAGGAIELRRTKDQWEITPGNFRADQDKVDGMLRALSNLELTALVSESGRYKRYLLDSQNRIRVEAFAGKRPLISLDIGKTAPTGRHTFVRPGTDKRIFHARGLLRSRFTPDPDSWRDTSILAFDPKSITCLRIRLKKRVLEIRPAAPGAGGDGKTGESCWLTAGGQKIAASKVKKLLDLLSETKCSRFSNDFPAPQTELEIELDLGTASPQSLSVASAPGSGAPYPARSSFQKTPFTLAASRAKLLIKTAESLFDGSGRTKWPG